MNVAARLEGLAEPGGICVSGTVHEHIAGKLGHAFTDDGEQMVKNIARPVRVWRWSGRRPLAAPSAQHGSATQLPLRPSVAVLPFTNMSGDPDQEHFSDGITEDIITELARNHGLFVMARNSAFMFKATAVDIAEVGRKLGVRYVVEGSVRRAGNRVRITAQLIEAATGSHVWAERYDRDVEDIFAVQDEVTQSIAGAVPGQLESDILRASRRKPTESMDAYEYYLRGKEILHRWRNDEIPQCKEAFERAVELDPTFARAHGVLGHMHLRAFWQTDDPRDRELADRETELGARLDGEDCECLCWRGQVLVFLRNFDEARATLERALQLKPGDPDLTTFLALGLAYMGQSGDAIDMIEGAMRANPYFPPWYHECIGLAFMLARRYEDALRSFAAMRGPAFYVHVWAAGCLMKLGRPDEARASSLMASKLRPDWVTRKWVGEARENEDKEHEEELARLALEALQDSRSDE